MSQLKAECSVSPHNCMLTELLSGQDCSFLCREITDNGSRFQNSEVHHHEHRCCGRWAKGEGGTKSQGRRESFQVVPVRVPCVACPMAWRGPGEWDKDTRTNVSNQSTTP